MLSSKDVEVDSRHLHTLGYETAFIQKDIPNHPAKNPFLYEKFPLHSLAYCQIADGISIELVQYTNIQKGVPSSYEVLFASLPKDTEIKESRTNWRDVWQSAMGCDEPKEFYISNFNTRFWCDMHSSRPQPGIEAILRPVNDLAAAKLFWQKGLNCDLVAESTTGTLQQWAKIVFRSPLKHWSLYVILAQQTSSLPIPMLNDVGFPCIALLTTDLTRDRERLGHCGVTASTGEFFLEINQKQLKVEVLRGSSGELIELLEILAT